ncbi:CaiB/BaiF CoA transferase family protein [Candidatus Aalborgicola defluviihabitans]|uniref:CaiB/BaiF CoA transferase family protein n=1 Tax=Candidatus Aalborgicola defluviihabitans TaxID=3386187 RepID=UPI001DBFDB92|nr:CoA transferase [Burkholderiales bacterium]
MTTSSIPPLQGIVVLDLTRFMSGPYATMLLADAGADVIKVEPLGGEETRTLHPILKDDDDKEISGYFLRLNRRKRSVCLDLRSPEGRDALIELAKGADVVVENYRPGVMNKLGIGAEVLMKANPRLIFCAISGFGQTASPNRDWPAFNLVPEAMAGVLSQSPTPGVPPRPVGPALGDLFPSMHAVSGILMALLRRHTTGQGSLVDIAMYDSMLSLNEMALGVASMTGGELLYGQRVNPNLAPYGYFPTKDGWVCIAVGPNRQWESLCKLMGHPEMGVDERLNSGSGRSTHFKDLIEPVLFAWLAERGKEEIAAELAAVGVPAAPVRNASEALDCEQARVRGMVADVHAPAGKSWQVAGSPVRLSPAFDLPEASTVRPGQNTLEVLTEIAHMTPDDARQFVTDPTLRAAPTH